MKNLTFILILLGITLIQSCKKDFLDAKPNKALLVPTTLADFQAILDDSGDMNVAPYLTAIASDDVYTTDAGYIAAAIPVQGSYLWAQDVYQGNTLISDWNKPFQQIFNANIVLDGLKTMDTNSSSQSEYNQVKGSALFFRALAYFRLAQEFAAPYNPSTAGTDLGIPIHLTSDVNILPGRGTVQQTYDQIIADLTQAKELLPLQTAYKTRPSRIATLGLLARTYLVMLQYEQAGSFANASLELNNKLIDYNTLTATAAYPLPVSLPNGNNEVSFYSPFIAAAFFVTSAVTSVDTTLYKSYATNDLRRTLFFNNKGNNIILFKGNYSGTSAVFAGVANDEVLLTRAECYARNGNAGLAMTDLNTLLQSRWKSGTFVPLTAVNADDALNQIITERRKELIYRDLRWMDLRRLNQDSRFAKTLTRVIQGKSYTLLPKDKRYVFPIPDYELTINNIPQNPR